MTRKTEAKCNGAMLTVGFHNANPPLIWRFDLERNHSFTLAMQGDDGEWELGITTPKGDFYPVVRFAAREDAEEALAKVERVLLGRKNGGWGVGKALLAVSGVAVVVVLGVALLASLVNTYRPPADASLAATGTPIVPATPPVGIPLPADEVLKPPPE